MRLRLNLIFQQNILKNESIEAIEYLTNEEFKFFKIIFPVNLKENYLIKDLKATISNFLREFYKTRRDIIVKNLCLKEFCLLDEFEINQVLDNDDEVR